MPQPRGLCAVELRARRGSIIAGMQAGAGAAWEALYQQQLVSRIINFISKGVSR